jgi:hypothetical protein
MSQLGETIYDEPPAMRWAERVSWGAMLALGWLIYEITARPAAGILVACAKFGWNDFVTAHWLIRRDPDRGRGRTCFWFYMASGLWRITVAAFIITGVILIVTIIMGLRGRPMPLGLMFTAITSIAGILLLAVVPLIGVLCARLYRVKVWIDSSIHAYRRAGIWPPEPTGINTTMGLLFPALMVPITLTAIVMFRFGAVPMLVSVFGEGIFLWSLFRGVSARTPYECWEPFFEEDDVHDHIFEPDDPYVATRPD